MHSNSAGTGDLDQTYFIPISDVHAEPDMDTRSSPFCDTTQHSRRARSHLHHGRSLKLWHGHI